jgi:trehalose 6-phosphate phosphatase
LTRPLFGRSVWQKVLRILDARDRALLVVLDLDGTIAPIAPRPELARVPYRTLRSLRQSAHAQAVRIAVLSARRLSDLRRLAPVRKVLLIGQYGLEGPVAPSASVLARYRRACARVTRALKPAVRSIHGALLEPKGLTVAVHNRNVGDALELRALHRALGSVASNEAKRAGFRPMPGSRVVDFLPRGFDKGRALKAILSRIKSESVFYFGDSEADEPAFAVLHRQDFPVRVGRGLTRARYRVASLEGVTRFLDAVAACRPARRDRRR